MFRLYQEPPPVLVDLPIKRKHVGLVLHFLQLCRTNLPHLAILIQIAKQFALVIVLDFVIIQVVAASVLVIPTDDHDVVAVPLVTIDPIIIIIHHSIPAAIRHWLHCLFHAADVYGSALDRVIIVVPEEHEAEVWKSSYDRHAVKYSANLDHAPQLDPLTTSCYYCFLRRHFWTRNISYSNKD